MESKHKFDTALKNDFNTPLALTEFFNMIKVVNGLAAEEKITKNLSDKIMPILEEILGIIGLSVVKTNDDEVKSVFQLIEKREDLRKNKQFSEADKLRDQISNMGIYLIDHKNRTLWMKKEKISSDIN